MTSSQFLIGAASSGSGKTTFTLGLLRALRNRGLNVCPFKCGPDYLDTKHHAAAAGHPSYNLDLFMSSAGHIRTVYARESRTADVSIVEGVMGLFDGYDNMTGSSAEVANILHLPVILIINARSTAYTVAAILYGFKHFRPEIPIAGAIFNFTGSASHYAYLKSACKDAGVTPLGYLPHCPDIEIPSRHLGLNIDQDFCFDDFAEGIARQIEQTVDIDTLLAITSAPKATGQAEGTTHYPQNLRISVACDEAFNFIYPENIHNLEKLGKVTYFSPLHDSMLPPTDFLYLPGGYPELHLSQLSENTSMLRSIRTYCEENGRALAECGGMMYLCDGIADRQGNFYPMCGFLPQKATMEDMKLKLGYRKVFINGQEFRGHEFHYSHIAEEAADLTATGKVTNAKGMEVNTSIFRKKQVTASYVHFYRGEEGQSLLDVAQCMK